MLFLTSRRLFVAAFLIGTLACPAAEISQEQIHSSLNSPADLTWTLTGASPWTADSAGIYLGTVPARSVHTIQTTVTGPGLIGLNLERNYGVFSLSVWIDGVRSGVEGVGSSTDPVRATVGAGVHSVRWQVARTTQFFPQNVSPLALRQATWEPFTEQSLSAGAGAGGIVLTSTGQNPWIGQSGMHHGDGGAVWSGLKIGHAPGNLRASFNGPGVLGFWYRTRGTGLAGARFDDGPEESLTGAPGTWVRSRRLVGPGPHTMDWSADFYQNSTLRGSLDLTVDEISLSPTVPLATALETPGRTWTDTSGTWAPSPAYGIEDATASGGSLVIAPYGTRLTTRVEGPALLKIRTRGATPWIEVGDDDVDESILLQGPPSEGWRDQYWELPAGESELNILGTWNLEIDRVEIIAPPASLAAALDRSAGSFTTGGADPWVAATFGETAGFGARIDAIRGHTDSWLELPVQGPAELRFSWKSGRDNRGFVVLVDGREIDLLEEYRPASRVRIEIPGGNHVVRWQARAPKAGDHYQVFTSVIGAIETVPLPPGGVLLPALDIQGPSSIPFGWTASSTIRRDGGETLQAPAGVAGSHATYRIKSNFTGPGEVSFWWYAGLPATGTRTARWSFEIPRLGSSSYYRDGDSLPGWKQEKLWLPPGGNLLGWEVSGTSEQVALTALDGILFNPSVAVSPGEALDAPDLPWANDPAKPWAGIILQDEAGDALISPSLDAGESARFSTVVQGPGKISFRWMEMGTSAIQGEFRVNGVLQNSSNHTSNGETVEILIPAAAAATLEWTATEAEWVDRPYGWIGVDGVAWEAFPAFPLPESLDSPATVVWKTSPSLPFTGRENPGAKNGTAAYVALAAGEESWLEATVDGPGVFDFWLRGAAGVDLSDDYIWNYWSLTIDGQPVAIGGTSWPAQWITGPGPHRIRLTLRNPEDFNREWIAGAVDDVSWIPLARTSLARATGLPGNPWRVGNPLRVTGYSNAGRNGGPAVVLRPVPEESSMIETTIKGPCELSWDSSLGENWRAYDVRQWLVIDGVKTIPIHPHAWRRMRLTLPFGIHTVRWLSEPAAWAEPPADGDPVAFDVVWRVGGMSVRSGIAPVAKALDDSTIFALETGDTGGSLVPVVGGDAWQPGPETSLFLFHPRLTGKMTTRWGHPDRASGGLSFSDAHLYVQELWSELPGWQNQVAAIQPGGFARWDYQETGLPAALLDAFKLEAGKATSLDAAIESSRPLAAENWFGRLSGQAKSGGDAAWSFLNHAGQSHPADITLTGPAKVAFWWKKTGPGSLRLSLDGGHLPVGEPGAVWSKVEFAINAGDHAIQWLHASDAESDPATPGEAWLDGLTLRKTPPQDLTRAAASGVPLYTSSDPEGSPPWHPVAHRKADGSWTEAVRAISGGRVLQTRIIGPAVLEFRGRCFSGFPAASPTSRRSKSVVIISPGDYTEILGHFLSIEVGGIAKLRIADDPSAAWQDGAVHIPAGLHEVTFRLKTLQRNFWGESIIEASERSLQGWVDEVRVVSPAGRFAAWALAESLPSALDAPGDDADGDGATNFLERTFGTSPLDGASRPPSLEFGAATRFRGMPELILKIPYLPSDASGVLESSDDLEHWETAPVQLLHYPPLSSWFELDVHTADYHSLRISGGPTRKYYRLRLSAD